MKTKAVIFLADGMADEALPELQGKTPLEFANTPAMDSIAGKGVNGTFLTLPDGLPTSSDVITASKNECTLSLTSFSHCLMVIPFDITARRYP